MATIAALRKAPKAAVRTIAGEMLVLDGEQVHASHLALWLEQGARVEVYARGVRHEIASCTIAGGEVVVTLQAG
jgi:hypothetical protein